MTKLSTGCSVKTGSLVGLGFFSVMWRFGGSRTLFDLIFPSEQDQRHVRLEHCQDLPLSLLSKAAEWNWNWEIARRKAENTKNCKTSITKFDHFQSFCPSAWRGGIADWLTALLPPLVSSLLESLTSSLLPTVPASSDSDSRRERITYKLSHSVVFISRRLHRGYGLDCTEHFAPLVSLEKDFIFFQECLGISYYSYYIYHPLYFIIDKSQLHKFGNISSRLSCPQNKTLIVVLLPLKYKKDIFSKLDTKYNIDLLFCRALTLHKSSPYKESWGGKHEI